MIVQPLLMNYKLDTFSAPLNQVKLECRQNRVHLGLSWSALVNLFRYWYCLKPVVADTTLPFSKSRWDCLPSKKLWMMSKGDGCRSGAAQDFVSDSVSFFQAPLQEEPNTATQFVSLAILWPSRVGPGDMMARIVARGHTLELNLTWSLVVCHVSVHLRKWTPSIFSEHMERNHSKSIGFKASLKQLRNASLDRVHSVANLHLLISVQEHVIYKRVRGWKDSCARILFVDLKARRILTAFFMIRVLWSWCRVR